MIKKITINKQESEYYTVSDSREGFLLCLPAKCTLNDFITAAKVESDTYASILISRLYHGLVTTSINVIEEYNKYYSMEYENLSSFLYWKYYINKKVSESFLSQLHQDDVLLYGKFSSGCSWTVNTFIDDDTMSKSLNIIINQIWSKYHENSK